LHDGLPRISIQAHVEGAGSLKFSGFTKWQKDWMATIFFGNHGFTLTAQKM
jgi:hypothetical protein